MKRTRDSTHSTHWLLFNVQILLNDKSAPLEKRMRSNIKCMWKTKEVQTIGHSNQNAQDFLFFIILLICSFEMKIGFKNNDQAFIAYKMNTTYSFSLICVVWSLCCFIAAYFFICISIGFNKVDKWSSFDIRSKCVVRDDIINFTVEKICNKSLILGGGKMSI